MLSSNRFVTILSTCILFAQARQDKGEGVQHRSEATSDTDTPTADTDTPTADPTADTDTPTAGTDTPTAGTDAGSSDEAAAATRLQRVARGRQVRLHCDRNPGWWHYVIVKVNNATSPPRLHRRGAAWTHCVRSVADSCRPKLVKQDRGRSSAKRESEPMFSHLLCSATYWCTDANVWC